MDYTLSYSQASSHYIDIKVEAKTYGKEKLQFQLPAWRPGRYELGNFAKNIQRWKAFDQDGILLPSKKLTKDLWEVDCKGVEKVIVEYNYFAHELNAGSTYLDEEQLYVNPVNCMIYQPERAGEECLVNLNLPEDYNVAIALEEVDDRVFKAKNFDELADSPFIASANLQHHEFNEKGTTFHLWFQGLFKANWEKIERDFRAFAAEQIKFFGDFPTKNYHFLFQILPTSFYHGVEHSSSTVIVLGPSYAVLDEKGRYEDLLGVSSHELFHTWNVKRIRPIEMWPYDFSKENYSRLGYLSEGATTWYGDLMLYRSKVFTDAAFFRTFNQLLDRHFNNPGVENLSVADSSFDTWLDGYNIGVPNRKASIYTEGALITFMLDVEIRKATNNEKSFDDVMRSFYNNYYKQGKGISEADYQNEVEKLVEKSMSEFFENYVNGTDDISESLAEAMDYFGLEYKKLASDEYFEAYLGIKVLDGKVISIYPNSIADRAGITLKDEVLSINSIKINNDLSAWLKYFKEDDISLQLIDGNGFVKEVALEPRADIYYGKYEVNFQKNRNAQQEETLEKWRGY